MHQDNHTHNNIEQCVSNRGGACNIDPPTVLASRLVPVLVSIGSNLSRHAFLQEISRPKHIRVLGSKAAGGIFLINLLLQDLAFVDLLGKASFLFPPYWHGNCWNCRRVVVSKATNANYHCCSKPSLVSFFFYCTRALSVSW